MAEMTLDDLYAPVSDGTPLMNEPLREPEDRQPAPVDEPVGEDSDLMVVKAVMAFKQEVEDARKDRDDLSDRNLEAYFGRQDWSDKIEGQSTEFLPKTSMAVDQVSTFIKRGVAGYGQWFQIELKLAPQDKNLHLTAQGIENLMRHRLEGYNDDTPGSLNLPTTLADGAKVGLLESMVILKVYGEYVKVRRPTTETTQRFTEGENGPEPLGTEEHLVLTEKTVWQGKIDLIRPKDFGIDPKGQFVQHYTEKELWQVIEDSEGEYAMYDPEVVKQIEVDSTNWERETDIANETNEPVDHAKPPFRKMVQLTEHWGILLNEDGRVSHRNIVCTVANDKYLIRKPTANPNWHQQSPFVYGPLLRVPFSTWHKALFDYAVDLNLALNQLFNLIVDGGIATVWGTRQVKLGLVENASDFTDGIPAGATFLLKPEAPAGEPVCMVVSTGTVPPDALATFNLLDREFQAASLNNDMKMGLLPPRQVKATEMVETSNQSSVFFESIIFDYENNIIRPALWKFWLTMLQHTDDWDAEDVVGNIGIEAASELLQMSPAKRYATYAVGAKFKVFGLSSVLARTKEFQKIMALFQILGQNPMLAQAFMARFSPDKGLDQIFRSLNIDPETIEMDEIEKAQLPQRMQEMAAFAQMMGGGQKKGADGEGGAGPELPAQINQAGNALSGLGGKPTRR